MRSKAKVYVRFLAIIAVLGTVGIASTIYVVIHQRVTSPFEATYTIKAAFTAADGVVSGIGQPVDVVGVPVGQITGVELRDGIAVVTMQLRRDRLPHLYRNANAALQPVTPLGDMRIDLEPGRPPARPLAAGATIGLARTNAPVRLSSLLSRLDRDTRDYLTGLLASLQQGTRGRAPDMRRTLLALGPTSRQVGQITRALALRRTALARFVHNLAAVTRAASQDGQLASVVAAGDQTLRAVAEQDKPLRQAIAKLPPTLDVVQSTLGNVKPFADKLGPTLTALLPAVQRLPDTLRALGRLADVGTPVLRRDVAPLVSKAQPLLRQAAPAVAHLTRATPPLTGAAQSLNYLLNELGHVPDGAGRGFLYWTAWGLHNLNSALSTADANGAILRLSIPLQCAGILGQQQLQKTLGVVGVCPEE